MSQNTFDAVQRDYEAIVEQSINFSGLSHDFFMAAKADLLRRVVANSLGQTGDLRLLDIGCGVGRLHAHLRDNFAQITGCDTSSLSLERARVENPFATYLENSPDRLPIEDNSFDVALTVCVMHHVPPENWVSFLREMHRVVRPKGIVVVIEHNPFNPLTRLAVARCSFDADANLLSGRMLRQRFLDAGFQAVTTDNFLFFPSAGALARRTEQLLRWLPLGAQHAAVAVA